MHGNGILGTFAVALVALAAKYADEPVDRMGASMALDVSRGCRYQARPQSGAKHVALYILILLTRRRALPVTCALHCEAHWLCRSAEHDPFLERRNSCCEAAPAPREVERNWHLWGELEGGSGGGGDLADYPPRWRAARR